MSVTVVLLLDLS